MYTGTYKFTHSSAIKARWFGWAKVLDREVDG